MEPVKLEVVTPTIQSLMKLSAVKRTETAIRTAYRSFDKMSNKSHEKLFQFCFKNMHWSVFEHHYLTVKVPKEISSEARFDAFTEELNPDFIRIFRNCKKYDVFKGNVRSFMDLWKSLITQFTYCFSQKAKLQQSKNYSDYETFCKTMKYATEVFQKNVHASGYRNQFSDSFYRNPDQSVHRILRSDSYCYVYSEQCFQEYEVRGTLLRGNSFQQISRSS